MTKITGMKNIAYLRADTASGVTVYPTEGELLDQNDIESPVPYLAPGDFHAILQGLADGEAAYSRFDLDNDEDGAFYEAIDRGYGMSGCIFTRRHCDQCGGKMFFWGMDDNGVRRCVGCGKEADH